MRVFKPSGSRAQREAESLYALRVSRHQVSLCRGCAGPELPAEISISPAPCTRDVTLVCLQLPVTQGMCGQGPRVGGLASLSLASTGSRSGNVHHGHLLEM